MMHTCVAKGHIGREVLGTRHMTQAVHGTVREGGVPSLCSIRMGMADLQQQAS